MHFRICSTHRQNITPYNIYLPITLHRKHAGLSKSWVWQSSPHAKSFLNNFHPCEPLWWGSWWCRCSSASSRWCPSWPSATWSGPEPVRMRLAPTGINQHRTKTFFGLKLTEISVWFSRKAIILLWVIYEVFVSFLKLYSCNLHITVKVWKRATCTFFKYLLCVPR